jgi:hypothetical protein
MRKLIVIVMMIFAIGTMVTVDADAMNHGKKNKGKKNVKKSMKKMINVTRPFGETFESVKMNADLCFNLTVTNIIDTDKGPIKRVKNFNTLTKQVGDFKGLTVIKLAPKDKKKPKAKKGKRSFKSMRIDMEAIDRKRTKIEMEGSKYGFDNIYSAIFAWANGEHYRCPKGPFGGENSEFEYQNTLPENLR